MGVQPREEEYPRVGRRGKEKKGGCVSEHSAVGGDPARGEGKKEVVAGAWCRLQVSDSNCSQFSSRLRTKESKDRPRVFCIYRATKSAGAWWISRYCGLETKDRRIGHKTQRKNGDAGCWQIKVNFKEPVFASCQANSGAKGVVWVGKRSKDLMLSGNM